jgi:hypothetical protein
MYGQERASVISAIAAVSLAFAIFAFLALRTRAAAFVTHVNASFRTQAPRRQKCRRGSQECARHTVGPFLSILTAVQAP